MLEVKVWRGQLAGDGSRVRVGELVAVFRDSHVTVIIRYRYAFGDSWITCLFSSAALHVVRRPAPPSEST